MAAARDVQFKIKLSEDERRMVQELADLDGVSASDVFRLFVRREHAARIGEKKRTKKK